MTFPFLRLPKELRIEILKLCDLVDWDYGDHEHQSIWINRDGKRRAVRAQPAPCWLCEQNRCLDCQAFTFGLPPRGLEPCISTTLLFINKQIHEEALEIFLGYNRIVLAHGHDKNLELLKYMPKHQRSMIRDLRIRFRSDFGYDFERVSRNVCCYMQNLKGWDHLVSWIQDNLNLPSLHLSVDLSEMYNLLNSPGWEDGYFHEPLDLVEVAMVARAYWRVARPLSQLHGLRSCFVFLGSHFRLEAEIEKATMGNSKYNSLAVGKVMPACRNFQLPLVWPPEEEEMVAWAKYWQMVDAAEHLTWYTLPLDDIVQARVEKCPHKDDWQ